MSVIPRLSATQAYRLAIKDGDNLAASDEEQGAWIMIATMLEHALRAPVATHADSVKQAVDLALERWPTDGGSTETHAQTLQRVIDHMERAGAKQLAAHSRDVWAALEAVASGIPITQLLAKHLGVSIEPPAELQSSDDPEVWEVDVAPLPLYSETAPTERRSMVLAVSGASTVGVLEVAHTPSALEDVCGLLLQAIAQGIDNGAPRPREVRVRLQVVADALERMFKEQGLSLGVVRAPLHHVDVTLESVRAEAYPDSTPEHFYISKPILWEAWGVEPAIVARLFEAAARYHIANPGAVMLAHGSLLWVRTPRRTQWLVDCASATSQSLSVMNMPFQPPMRDVYSGGLMNAVALTVPPVATQIVLRFWHESALHPVMRDEVQRAGWVIRNPTAYPMITVLHSPGGGITASEMSDLAAVADAIPRFAAANGNVLFESRILDVNLDWTDPLTGVAFEYGGRADPLTIMRMFEDIDPMSTN